MKRVVRLSYFLMAVAAVLAVFLAFKYQSLSASVKNTKATLATFQSASLYVQGGSYAYEDLGNRFLALCRQGRDRELIEFCKLHGAPIRVIGLLGPAFRARMSAPLNDDYKEMRQRYMALVAVVEKEPESDWQKGWLALAKEGVAYAEMKLGRLEEAERFIEEADRLNPNDASVGATALKLQCVRHAPKQEVAANFATVSRRLKDRIDSTNAATELGRNARLELKFFALDGELYQLCDYADLQPPSGA